MSRYEVRAVTGAAKSIYTCGETLANYSDVRAAAYTAEREAHRYAHGTAVVDTVRALIWWVRAPGSASSEWTTFDGRKFAEAPL